MKIFNLVHVLSKQLSRIVTKIDFALLNSNKQNNTLQEKNNNNYLFGRFKRDVETLLHISNRSNRVHNQLLERNIHKNQLCPNKTSKKTNIKTSQQK
jgi:hypothetical protein